MSQRLLPLACLALLPLAGAGAGRAQAASAPLVTVRAPLAAPGQIRLTLFVLKVPLRPGARPAKSLPVVALRRRSLPPGLVLVSRIRLLGVRAGVARYLGELAQFRRQAPAATPLRRQLQKRAGGDYDALEGIVAGAAMLGGQRSPEAELEWWRTGSYVEQVVNWAPSGKWLPKPDFKQLEFELEIRQATEPEPTWAWSPSAAPRRTDSAGGAALTALAASLRPDTIDPSVLDAIESSLDAQFAREFPEPAGELAGDSASLQAALPQCGGFAAQGSNTGAVSVSFSCRYGAKGLGAGSPLTLGVSGGNPEPGGRLTFPGGSLGGNCTVAAAGAIGCGLADLRAGDYSQQWFQLGRVSSCGIPLAVTLTLQPPDGRPPLLWSARLDAAC